MFPGVQKQNENTQERLRISLLMHILFTLIMLSLLKVKLEDLCFLKNFIDTAFQYLTIPFSSVNKTNLQDNKRFFRKKRSSNFIFNFLNKK